VSTLAETQLKRNPQLGSGVVINPPGEEVARFHSKLPGYQHTPLVSLDAVAGQLGLGKVLVKVESNRLELPSFKMLGASWATYRAIVEHTGMSPNGWETLDEFATELKAHGPISLAAATDGNHGRAVARMGRMLGIDVSIWAPHDMARARIEAIESEGAKVTVIDGYYDDAIALSATQASDTTLVISDTSWEGYEDVPGWVIDGYSTIFAEADTQMEDQGLPMPTHVITPMGVGALAAATVAHYDTVDPRPTIVGVEPSQAACVQAALDAGKVITIESEFKTQMVGLNCGTASQIAYPVLAHGLDWSVAIDDDWAEDAMRLFADNGLVSGETGASTMGGLLALLSSPLRGELGLDQDAEVLVIITEGATDPVNYERIVGKAPTDV
jgi:diaminopropionate ammonia-lyase